MKTLFVLLVCCLSSVAQNPDAIKYAPRQVLLVDPTPGTEAVLPMMFLTEGKQHLEFVPVHQIKESMDKGGRPIALADILAALGEATEKINQLQDENDRLWKVALKDSPKSEIVVVPQTEPSQAQIAAQRKAEANLRRQQTLQMWLMLQNSNRQQPYQLPMPINPNANRLQTNCTIYKLGDMTHTTCN